MSLDIAFSDHRMALESLQELGAVIAAIHDVCGDDELCFWSFIRYVSLNHSSMLGVNLKPEVETQCDAILSQARLPQVTMRPSPREASEGEPSASSTKRWWQFWKSSPNLILVMQSLNISPASAMSRNLEDASRPDDPERKER